MNTDSIAPASAERPARSSPWGLTLAPSTQRALVLSALSMGILGDALFRDLGPGPVSFTLWVAAGVMALWSLVKADTGTVPREAVVWFALAIVFAACTAWRNTEMLQPLNTVAALGCLALAAIRLRDDRAGILAERIRLTVMGGIQLGIDGATGWARLLLAGGPFVGLSAAELGPKARTIVRPIVLGAVVLMVFGSLLRGADPIFASLTSVPTLDFGSLFLHALVIGFFGVVMAGWGMSALLPRPTHVPLANGYGFTLGAVDIYTILGTLDALFATFVIVQLGWFFGGERFLHARTGLTAAQYARGGFFELVVTIMLVVPVLLVTRSALRDERGLTRTHTLLAVPTVVLLGAMIASAMARMSLYVRYFGLTSDRFFTMVFMGWLAVTLFWLSVTVLRGWGRPFALGAVATAAVTLLGLNALDPDAIVARIDIARGERLGPTLTNLDVNHLANLGGGATPYAIRELLRDRPADASRKEGLDARDRCYAAGELLRRFGPVDRLQLEARRRSSWRFWNADDVRARRDVDTVKPQLEAIRTTNCDVWRGQQRKEEDAARRTAPAASPGAVQR